MGICVFLSNQKVQRVDAKAIEVLVPSPPSAPPPSAPPPSAPPAELGVVELLEKQIADTKKVAELRRQLAEAQALIDAPTRSTWNPLF